MSVLLETVGLKKYFQTAAGKLHAVDDINLKIGKGETLGVVGESGCGKSTLGRVILRLLEADAGQILFEGKDILKRTKAQMKDVRTQMQINYINFRIDLLKHHAMIKTINLLYWDGAIGV